MGESRIIEKDGWQFRVRHVPGIGILMDRILPPCEVCGMLDGCKCCDVCERSPDECDCCSECEGQGWVWEDADLGIDADCSACGGSGREVQDG